MLYKHTTISNTVVLYIAPAIGAEVSIGSELLQLGVNLVIINTLSAVNGNERLIALTFRQVILSVA